MMWLTSLTTMPTQQCAADRNNARYQVAGRGKTESFSADEPVILLRVRAPTAEQDVNQGACDGVMIWFEKPKTPLPNGTAGWSAKRLKKPRAISHA